MKGNLGNVGYISKDMGKETKKKKSKDWLGMVYFTTLFKSSFCFVFLVFLR